MSFDAYVQFFANGREAGIAPDLVRAAFPGLVEVLDDDYWLLRFGEGATTDLFLRPASSDPHLVHSLSFHKPAGDARLWRGIFALLGNAGAVFHCPGGGPAVVRDASSPHLSDAMRDGFGAVQAIADEAALAAAFAAAMARAEGS